MTSSKQAQPISSADLLPRVDSHDKPSPLLRAYIALLRTSFGRWVAMNVAPWVDPWLLRVTPGRVGMGLTLPSALLARHGARVLDPTAVPVPDGWPAPRSTVYRARTLLVPPTLQQEPPRTTRRQPVSGPGGSSFGGWLR